MSELQKRHNELEMEWCIRQTENECIIKMEVEKLENELGMKTVEMTKRKREANQIKAQIDEIKNDLDLKGKYFSLSVIKTLVQF